MKKLIGILCVLVLGAGVVFAGSSGLDNGVTKFTRPSLGNDDGLEAKVKTFNDAVVTWADTVETELDGEVSCTTLAVSGSGTIGGDLAVTGTITSVGGLNLKYANKTDNYTNSATDVVLSYATSHATTNTLPEASTVLGSAFMICLQADTGDLVVKTDATDKFDGTNNQITFADAGDSCILMATAANVYTIIVNVGGTLTTQ